MRCTGHNRDGTQCKNGAVDGTTKCRMHGGKSLKGMAHPNYKTGKFSKHLPTRLLAQYHASLSDNRALSLREDIAVTDARITELVGRIDTQESGSAWQHVRDGLADLRTGLRVQDSQLTASGLRQIQEAVNAGQSDYNTWQELHATIDQRRKLVESERKLMVELQQMMTIEDANLLIDTVVQSIRRNVTDVSALRAIQADISTLLGTDPGRSTDASRTIDAEFD